MITEEENRPNPDELLASFIQKMKKQTGQTENILRYVCRCWQNLYHAADCPC